MPGGAMIAGRDAAVNRTAADTRRRGNGALSIRRDHPKRRRRTQARRLDRRTVVVSIRQGQSACFSPLASIRLFQSVLASVTNIRPGAWVMQNGSRAATATACGVTPHAQKTGSSPASIATGSP